MKLRIHYFKPSFLLRLVRSIWASRKVTASRGIVPIRIKNLFLSLNITVAPSARFVCNGVLRIEKFRGGSEPISIVLGEMSELIIDGDFIIGNGTRIIIDTGASLYIGGKRLESASGITERSLIAVRKKIHIGADCIIAWNVFITDCDWHSIYGKDMQDDVTIGDHVWIACNTSILKGSNIGNNCIIGAHSIMSKKTIPNNTLAAGNPIKIIENNIRWSRDILDPDEIFDLRPAEGELETQ